MPEAVRVAVVGGGPAGATCARELVAAGAQVDLFEAEPGSEKPCGGGVPSAVMREFPELTDVSLQRRIVREVILYSPSNRRVAIPLRRGAGIHMFKRRDLDTHLRRRAVAAGAGLRETKVQGVRRLASGRWELLTGDGPAGPYDRLVAADGVRGAVRRALAGRFDERQLTLALYAYLPAVTCDDTCHEMVLKFFGDFDGYLWVFPRTDHLSVGICAGHRSVEPARLEDELRRFVDTHYPVARAPRSLQGYFIPSSPEPIGPARGDGWALAGDAAGFVDPLTREGISWAMRSGAEVARGMLRAGELRTPPLPDNLRWAHRYRHGFYQGAFLERMTRLASASSALRGVLADLFAGEQGYGRLKARLLLNALPCGLQVGSRVLRAFARG